MLDSQAAAKRLSTVIARLRGLPAPGVPELLRMQLGMANMAVQLEVVGKTIARSTQNIDQLVRVLDGFAHLHEQLDPLILREPRLIFSI